MRADRLVATLLLLQARGRVTAAELAAELEVSVATARRDLEALSMAGIPVYPQVGRGGGWALVGGSRTDLTGLTAGEVQALFVLAGPATAAAPELKSALRKVVRALPETFRSDAEAAARSVVIDPARWGDRDRARPPLVEVLQRAVVQRRRVRFTYRSRSGRAGRSGAGGDARSRLVDPWGLVDKDDVWYLVAGTDDGQRTFRLDRMTDVVVTDLAADRPDDFDLDAAWTRVVDEVEAQRSAVEATVLLAPDHAPVLCSQFGRQSRVDGTEADGRVRVTVSAPAPVMIAQVLAGWGALVELVGSPAVRAELVRLTAELAARYR